MQRRNIIIGMSGGVDSSVAALRLLEAGHAVQGLFMQNWAEDEEGYCQAAEDFQDARAVCEILGIPLHRVDFSREYRERVFAAFLDGYRRGVTPNPDVLCNREIKFGSFLAHARRLGAEAIATGHYARSDGSGRLLRAADTGKDQTYFLHAVPREALRHAVFPLGDLLKSEVRAIAKANGLPNHDRKDSTGICFIGERPFADFLGRYLPDRHGDIVGPDGTLLGRHQGLSRYTLGQRQGLGIGGIQGQADAPWYVAGKDPGRNTLLVVQGHDHPALLHRRLLAVDPHWICNAPDAWPLRCTARTRHRQPDRPCAVMPGPDGTLEVLFDAPQRALTPGQFVVFYDGPLCLGGATIERVGGDPGASRPEATARHGAPLSA
ncbi:tRNA 2-thiouridine(34) synthase MnmA [Thioalkalivibrio sp. XN279]|uniref:tRNA 2-thiouridine(34) synthase MnmA n=1 Tax=Thioalkalivibrio sp. XN279 TaxID=2714953 RepID=UPI00140CB327|nr:tRNA 2-thiouridine(34) synthase MnmA [Thioalkalivibrio sp. XN279]NHA14390.1 tRNA 2-thiouridine(34) synthase MnmA [Thioalkalivibrio sp. XN279]